MNKARNVSAVVLLAALVLVFSIVPFGGLAEGMSDYAGIWEMSDGQDKDRLVLYEDGTGAIIDTMEYSVYVDQIRKTVTPITWTADADNIIITYQSGHTKSYRTSKPPKGSRQAYVHSHVKNGDSRSDLYISTDGRSQLFLLPDNTYIVKNIWNDVENDFVTLTGPWYEDASYVYLYVAGEKYAVHCSDGGWYMNCYFHVQDDPKTVYTNESGVHRVQFNRPTGISGGGVCPACEGNKIIIGDCYACKDGLLPCRSSLFPCNNTGKIKCMLCGGRGERICGFCDGTEVCSACRGNGAWAIDVYDDRFCVSCWSSGKCRYCDDNGGYVKCHRCDGTGYEDCSTCEGKGGLTHNICNGQGSFVIQCPYCAGSGVAPAATPTPTPAPTPTPGPRASFAQQNGASCSGTAWNAAVPACGKDVLKQLTGDYALEITFTASGNGHVWICLPQSKAGWTGIGQQDPIIRGNKVIIPYDTVVKAAGSSSSWGSQLYIKGSTEWKVTQIRVIYWPD